MRVVRIRRLAAPVAACVLLTCGACASNLKVTKVPLAERECGVDHQKGFRYYLNRPYLVVKKPVLVTEMVSLVRLEPARPGQPGAAKDGQRDMTVTFLDGPRLGQSMPLSSLQLETPGGGGARTMTAAELERIGSVLAARKAGGVDDDMVIQARNQITIQDRDTSLQVGPPAPLPAAQAGVSTQSGTDNSGASGDTSIQIDNVKPTGTYKDQAGLIGDMEIVYLPDLDEQYAIDSCNLLAKTAFGLAFRNGTELSEVSGEHDATTLALSLLQQVQTAISTAAGVEQERIKKNAKVTQGSQSSTTSTKADTDPRSAADQKVWQMYQRTWIKPGVYRLNKPWEIAGGPAHQPTGCGLLVKLGLPLVIDIDYKPVGTITKSN